VPSAEAVYTDVVAVSADGTTATMGAGFPTPGSGKIPASANYVLGTVDLATGAVAKTSGDLAAHYPTLLSPNGRFGIAWDAGHVWVVPTVAGATLPGGTDGAAALAFTSYSSGCTGAQPILQPSGRPSVGLRIGTYSISGFAVPPVSLAVRAIVVANGAVMNAFTLTPASNSRSINGYFGAITLDVVARFPGGTTSTGRGSVPAYSPPTCPPLIL